MRIAIVNEVWSPEAPTPESTLDRFTTLTGWCEAVAARGPEVVAFQRFRLDGSLARRAVRYHFIHDAGPPHPSAAFRGSVRLHEAVAQFRPDVVHVNGLDYPVSLRRLKRRLPERCAVVVQDHGGFDPARISRPRKMWLRYGLRRADALLVATPPQVEAFRSSGVVPRQVRVRDVMEGSTTLRATTWAARDGGLRVLWVGRLNENKDPLTVCLGFSEFLIRHPEATLTFVYQEAALESQLKRLIRTEDLDRAVRLLGRVPHDRLADAYAAADLFVLGSHREGSGYAVLEALACGVPPVVTDIPPFRWLTDGGRLGALWTPGDAASLCVALEKAVARPAQAQRDACRRRFDDHFSWEAIGRRAVEIYEDTADGLSRTS